VFCLILRQTSNRWRRYPLREIDVKAWSCTDLGRSALRSLVALAGASLSGLVATGAPLAAATVPNPCTLVSSTVLDATLGLKTGTSVTGKPSSQKKGGTGINPPVYTLSVCTFIHGGGQVQIEVGPKGIGLGSGGGPPGMVARNEPTLGPGATYLYDANPKFAFAQVTFIKGAYWVEVAANSGKIAPAKVLTLGRAVFAKVG
jgi:hypothetical protein